ncbi:hypothetical protein CAUPRSCDRAFT_10557 [Caulochytrium protostelioides]|uniref:LIM zinc-binding domain-containing protein n=1 Tax=Caulochytrium protostelioides TaxID=1555241 RepID=A0A4P9WWQ3_9FUNG|nr:hypothetical protein CAUPRSCDRAFT_10557 [Caulochytrium protostelioides]
MPLLTAARRGTLFCRRRCRRQARVRPPVVALVLASAPPVRLSACPSVRLPRQGRPVPVCEPGVRACGPGRPRRRLGDADAAIGCSWIAPVARRLRALIAAHRRPHGNHHRVLAAYNSGQASGANGAMPAPLPATTAGAPPPPPSSSSLALSLSPSAPAGQPAADLPPSTSHHHHATATSAAAGVSQSAAAGSSSNAVAAPNASSGSGSGSAPVKEPRICIACMRRIEGQFVRALNHHYHLDCFRCHDCHQVVADKFFPLKTDAPASTATLTASMANPPPAPSSAPAIFCEKDYFRRLDLLCAQCGGALRGPHINALGKKWHLEHFTCSICTTLFQQNDSYYEREGRVYCQYHYSVLFATRCGGCETAVLKNFVEMKRREGHEGTVAQWHPECYMIYKLWNVRISGQGESKALPPPQPHLLPAAEGGADEQTRNASLQAAIAASASASRETKDQALRHQQDVTQKVSKILHVLSAFEESSAECISDMLLHFSNQRHAEGVIQASKFICHIEALFRGIDVIESGLAATASNPPDGSAAAGSLTTTTTTSAPLPSTSTTSHKEPRQLAKRIVDFFSLLSVAREAQHRAQATKEMITLVTALAHTLKTLIRGALTGALRLEARAASAALARTPPRDAVYVFLDRLVALGDAQPLSEARKILDFVAPMSAADPLAAPDAGGADAPASESGVVVEIKTDLCQACRKSIEEECYAWRSMYRWHPSCLHCRSCQALLRPTATATAAAAVDDATDAPASIAAAAATVAAANAASVPVVAEILDEQLSPEDRSTTLYVTRIKKLSAAFADDLEYLLDYAG